VKITGEIVGTYFNIGGTRAVNVSVERQDNIYNDKLGIVGLGIHLIDIKNITDIEN
jgi:hypothetical protein